MTPHVSGPVAREPLELAPGLEFMLAFVNSPVGIGIVDLSEDHYGELMHVNPAFVTMMGYDDENEMLGMTVASWTPAANVEHDTRRLAELIRGEAQRSQYTKTYQRRDGSTFPALVTTSVSWQLATGPVLVSHVIDITEREVTSALVERHERQLAATFERGPIGMIVVKGAPEFAGEIVHANQAMADILHYSVGDLVGRRTWEFLVPAEMNSSRDNIVRISSTGDTDLDLHRRAVRADGQVIDLLVHTTVMEVHPVDGPILLAHIREITAELEQQRQLKSMALTDPLTGVGNRPQLSAWLAELHGREEAFGLCALDLDRFKDVNDSLGHHVGDELLVSVAARLCGLTDDGKVARLGGDEFVVVLTGTADAETARRRGRRIARRISEPYDLSSGHRIAVSASAGVALASTGVAMEELLRRADLALYAAKSVAGQGVALCDEELLGRAARRREAEETLRHAIEDETLEVHLQPIVSLADERLIALEALVRLRDRTGRLLYPDHFIRVAEETGLITEIDRLVTLQAIGLIAVDHRFADPDIRVSINVSGRSLAYPGLADHIERVLAAHGSAGRRLILEVTEHSLLEDNPNVRQTMEALAALGVDLAVDDFGTGYSALAYLRRFRMQHLKVDRSFVAELPESSAASTARAIIQVGHAHGMSVIAEGVETREQAHQLRELGCDFAQGWLFGRPQPPETSPEP